MNVIPLLFERLAHHQGLPDPAYHSLEAAGLDLHTAEDVRLAPGERRAVSTGLKLALPPGTVGLVFIRSGHARLHGVTVANGVGVIDSDYRGELFVLVVNLGQEHVLLPRGERFAQLVVAPFLRVEPQFVPTLPLSERGEGGFGSTGR